MFIHNPHSTCSSITLQRLYRVDDLKKLELLDELELNSGEDAPMSMVADLEVWRDSINAFTVSLYTVCRRIESSVE